MRLNYFGIPVAFAGLALLVSTFPVSALSLGASGHVSTPTSSETFSKQVAKQVNNPDAAKVSDLISRANPYVHVSNGKATIDPAIRNHLSAQDVAWVEQAVAKYNTQPPASLQRPLALAKPNAACPAQVWVKTYWWGTQYYLNHCAVLDLKDVVSVIPYGDKVSTAILDPFDRQCGNGVLLNSNWLGVPPFIPYNACGVNLKDGFRQIL